MLLASVSWLPCPSTSLSPCSFPAIFNFGDSNSDTGGLSVAFRSTPPPNGLTHIHAPAGRDCDGQLLIDFIGPPDLNAYLASVGTNFSHGANFAVAGATIRQTAFNPISLGEDLRFLINKSAAFEKLLPKEDYLPRALYTFDIGQKDLTAGYKLNLTTQVVKAYVPYLLTQFSSILKDLSILLWLVVVMVGSITITANKWIFEQIANGSFSDQPLPLRIACNRQDH
ncbi:hypothetical protein QUC31_014180 [Theobroma cacao]